MRATLRHPTGKPSRRNRVDRRVPRRPIRSGSGVELSTEELALSPGWGKAPGVPVEWQRSTMAHLCSVYPFHADVGFGHRGVLLGTNVTAGMSGFYFDPFEFYAQRHLTNPNMIVMGSVGYGKSATVKAFIRRLKAVYGADRYLAVIDPKGEYGAVAADLGLAVVKLHPGGSDRINPMEIVGGDADGACRRSAAAGNATRCRGARSTVVGDRGRCARVGDRTPIPVHRAARIHVARPVR